MNAVVYEPRHDLQALGVPRSILAEAPMPHRVSKRYVHIDSRQVVDAMLDEGFVIAKVDQRKSKDAEYGMHEIDFRLPEVPEVGGAIPRVIFRNAHDGTSGARMMMGMYRFVCSNGLVVGSTYATLAARHVGNAAADLIERIQKLARNTTPLFKQIETWQSLELSDSKAKDFARFAAQLRFGDADRFDTNDILRVVRSTDDKRDLWTVFNRVQENVLHGGFEGKLANGHAIRAKPLVNLDSRTEFNQGLWRLAEEFAE